MSDFLCCEKVFSTFSWLCILSFFVDRKEDDLQNQITTVATRSTTPKINKDTQRYQDFLDKYKCKNYVLEFIYQLRYYSFLCFVFSLFTHTHTHTQPRRQHNTAKSLFLRSDDTFHKFTTKKFNLFNMIHIIISMIMNMNMMMIIKTMITF